MGNSSSRSTTIDAQEIRGDDEPTGESVFDRRRHRLSELMKEMDERHRQLQIMIMRRSERQDGSDERVNRPAIPEERMESPTEQAGLLPQVSMNKETQQLSRLPSNPEKLHSQDKRESEVPVQKTPSKVGDDENPDEDQLPVLHVRGIPSGVEVKHIMAHFMRNKNGGCGDVEQVVFPHNAADDAYVYFADVHTVERVLRLDHTLGGAKLTVEIPKSKKQVAVNARKVEEDTGVQHQVECGICADRHPIDKMFSLATCGCHMCEDCAATGFTVMIRDKKVRKWGCPACSKPEMDAEMFEHFCYMLAFQLPALRDFKKETKDLFDQKLNEWFLMKSANFRWCAHCQCGFEWDPSDSKRMKCHKCRGYTCFDCKEKWLIQHDGETCERFSQWKKDNDPEEQAKALDNYLKKHGIDCPACKFRYDLARGGCLHFTCPQCDYVFCGSCKQQFRNEKKRGLYCQHLRNCLEGMRDRDVGELQSLLQRKRLRYDRDRPAGQRACPVMLTDGETLADRPCGKDTLPREAGFCTQHYKEYLIELVRKNEIDPSELPISSLSSDSSANAASAVRNRRVNPYAIRA